LDLSGLTSIPKEFNPTVGGSLYLSGLTSIPKEFNPTVGGDLDLSGLISRKNIKTKQLPPDFHEKNSLYFSLNLKWQNGRYRKIDGIFCEIIKKHKNVLKVKIKNEISYIVKNGNLFSHGKTIKEAKESLIYKISNRDTSIYKNLKLDSILSFEESVKMYRIITGACEFGTKNFVLSIKKKTKYSIREIIELTKGQWGNQKLQEFFKKEM